jgi:hypothetical protein
MSKNSFDLIMDWPYHPQLTIAIAFAVCFSAAMQGGGPIWAGLIAAAFTTPFAALLLFLPYLITVVALAILFSLFQAILQAPRPYKQS